jgi:glucose/arabinose dehydrogenase
MTVVSGDRFAAWKGDLLVGALKYQLLVRLEVRDGKIVGEERMLEGEYGRIRDVQQGPDGAIYLLTDEDDGQLLRLTPAGN